MKKEKKEEKKAHLIFDEKNPNGRPETNSEREIRINKETALNEAKKQEEKDKLEYSQMSDKIKNLVIPKTNMIPAPMRIFVTEVIPDIIIGKGFEGKDIIMATEFDAGNRDEDTKTKVRYFCVAVGDTVKLQTFNDQIMEPGDEIMYMDIPDAIRVEVPTVFDYDLLDRTGERAEYKLFDVMEIAGIIKKRK